MIGRLWILRRGQDDVEGWSTAEVYFVVRSGALPGMGVGETSK